MTDNITDNPADKMADSGSNNASDTETPRRRRTPRRTGKGAADLAATPRDAIADGAQNGIAASETITSDKAIGKILPFMKLEKPMAMLSALIVLVSVAMIFIRGLNLGLDFTGGVSADVVYSQPVEIAVVTSALADKGFTDAQVQYLGTQRELLVRLPPHDGDAQTLTKELNDALTMADNPVAVDNLNIIGGQLGNEIYLNSLLALAVALGCMLLYVAVRFQFKLGVGAILALVHDTVVVVGVFALFGFPFDLTVLAAVLALIGYSLNDTIVVYDRIRENFRRVRGLSARQIVDLSLTETLRRTFMTVGTVLVVVLAMLFLGGEGLYWFALALLIGLVAGTYSSMYIASSIPLMMGLSRQDFVVKVKPEFVETEVVFAPPENR